MRSAVAARSHIRRQNLALARQRKRRIFYVFTSSGSSVTLGWMVSDFSTSKPTFRRSAAEFSIPVVLQVSTAFTYQAWAEFWQTQKPRKSWQDASFQSLFQVASPVINMQWNQAFDPSVAPKRQINQAFDAPLAPPSLTPNIPLVASEFWQTAKPIRAPRESVFFIWPVTQIAPSVIWGWEAQFGIPRYHLGMKLDGFNNFVSQPTHYPSLSILIIGDFSPTSLLVYDYNGAVDLCG